MAEIKKKMTYYPGCSSEGSGMHLDTSLRAVLPELGIEISDIDDWNCCGASVGLIGGGGLATTALSARNLANAVENGNDEVITGCAACYLNTHGSNLKIRNNDQTKADVNEALKAGNLQYQGQLKVRHACEVLVNDIGNEAIKERVTKPLEGLKVAGYVGCQTVRPFINTAEGGNYDVHDQPKFLDDFATNCGADALDFEARTNCCGGSVAVMKPEATIHLIKDILEEAHDKGADVISTPCPLCQTNVEMYQDRINAEYGTKFNMPVVFYTQIMAKAFGMDNVKDAALHQNTIRAKKLEDI